MNVDYKLIGSRIKIKRKAMGITQEQLAEVLSVTVGYVSQIERGVTKINLEILSAISLHLHCDITFFVTGVSTSQEVYLQDEIVGKYSQLNKTDKQIILEIMDILIEKHRNDAM